MQRKIFGCGLAKDFRFVLIYDFRFWNSAGGGHLYSPVGWLSPISGLLVKTQSPVPGDCHLRMSHMVFSDMATLKSLRSSDRFSEHADEKNSGAEIFRFRVHYWAVSCFEYRYSQAGTFHHQLTRAPDPRVQGALWMRRRPKPPHPDKALSIRPPCFSGTLPRSGRPASCPSRARPGA